MQTSKVTSTIEKDDPPSSENSIFARKKEVEEWRQKSLFASGSSNDSVESIERDVTSPPITDTQIQSHENVDEISRAFSQIYVDDNDDIKRKQITNSKIPEPQSIVKRRISVAVKAILNLEHDSLTNLI